MHLYASLERINTRERKYRNEKLLPLLQNEVSSDVFLFILTFNGNDERRFGKNGPGFKPNHDTNIEGIITSHSNPYQFLLGHRLAIFSILSFLLFGLKKLY